MIKKIILLVIAVLALLNIKEIYDFFMEWWWVITPFVIAIGIILYKRNIILIHDVKESGWAFYGKLLGTGIGGRICSATPKELREIRVKQKPSYDFLGLGVYFKPGRLLTLRYQTIEDDSNSTDPKKLKLIKKLNESPVLPVLIDTAVVLKKVRIPLAPSTGRSHMAQYMEIDVIAFIKIAVTNPYTVVATHSDDSKEDRNVRTLDLLPQITSELEGMVSDWIYTNLPTLDRSKPYGEEAWLNFRKDHTSELAKHVTGKNGRKAFAPHGVRITHFGYHAYTIDASDLALREAAKEVAIAEERGKALLVKAKAEAKEIKMKAKASKELVLAYKDNPDALIVEKAGGGLQYLVIGSDKAPAAMVGVT